MLDKAYKTIVLNESKSAVLQKAAFKCGYSWFNRKEVRHTEQIFLYFSVEDRLLGVEGGIQYGDDPDYFARNNEYRLIGPNALLCLFETNTHTITIDGKEIILSKESFEELKKQLLDN